VADAGSARSELPLGGVEVLDVGTQTPGKYASLLLAELGAAVVRIERPARPEARGISAEDLHLNRGKRSIALDLRSDAGREVALRLAARADVLIESFRPGVAGRLGIGPSQLRARNPRLVYCSLSGFGQEGPYRDRPAYDLTLLGLSGVLDALFGTAAAPRPPGTYLADGISGLVSALAIAAALHGRERSGEGRHLDLAMLDSIFSLLSVSHGARRSTGEIPTAPSRSPLYDCYETADGRFLTLAAIRPASGRALLEALGRPDLAEQAVSSGEAGEAVAAFLRDTFKGAPAHAWLERLAPLDLEIGPVHTPAEAFDDPQLRARAMVLDTSHPEAGDHQQIGSALGTGATRAHTPLGPAPAAGADTEEVLRELGYEAATIAALRGSPVGDSPA
jgi:alpha-methylacyl-CoA racemase